MDRVIGCWGSAILTWKSMSCSQVAAGRLRATTATGDAIREADAVITIVPVKLTVDRRADLSIIESIARLMATCLRGGSLVSFETTLPVGTTRRLGELIAGSARVPGVDFHLVFSPERVKSRSVLSQLGRTPKVVGGLTQACAAAGDLFYKTYLGVPVHNVGTLEAAEYTKLAGMVYRDVNIALANELEGYAATLGLNFRAIRAAANTDGETYLLEPGIGVGGHCTPVYPHFLLRDAEVRQLPLPLVRAARDANEAQPGRILDRAGDLRRKRLTILGLAFRPEVKEATCSPAFNLAARARAAGATVRVHDPLFSAEEIRAAGLEPGDIEGAEVLVLQTAHSAYRGLDFGALHDAGARTVVDGRGLWSREEVERHGLTYIGVGG
jgi:nucleotide sugar dehydrogenase